MTIRVRLAMAYAATLALSVLLVGVVVWWQQGLSLRAALDARLASEVTDLEQVVRSDGPSAILEAGDEPDVVFVAVFDNDGHRVAAVPGTPPSLGPPQQEGIVEQRLDEGSFVLHVRGITDQWKGVAGASLGPIEAAQASLAGTITVAAVVAAVLSLLAGWWLAGRALAPVGALTAEAAAIGSSDLAKRLPVGSHRDELSRLATTLNDMLDRLEGGVLRQRAFLAAASHDLRTPISALQAELELADHPDSDVTDLRAAVVAARADVVRLGDLTAGLLDHVSAGPDGRLLVRSTVPLRGVVASVIDHVRPLADAQGVGLRVDVPDVSITVDRVRLELALRNVLANAVAYSARGELVEIKGSIEPDPVGSGTSLVVDVLDHGPGIPPGEADLVFEPFARGSNARGTGSGLGLSAARAAVEAHQGTLVASSRPDGGARLSLQIPL